MRTFLLLLALGATLTCAQIPCDASNCLSPDCRCFSTVSPIFDEIMGGSEITQSPQFVVLSFDDAVTEVNFQFYLDILSRKNFNGCPITATFFNTHMYNNYSMVNELQRRGNEIAIHTVSHLPDVQNYWRPATYDVWKSEIVDMRDMLVKYGVLTSSNLKGFRAPFLEMGGDEMYSVLYDEGFLYDCSWTSLQYTNWFAMQGGIPKGGAYPYTLDYLPFVQDCPIGRCPTKTYPGLWITPMLDLQDYRKEACAMLDTCQGVDNVNGTECAGDVCEDNVFNLLLNNFNYNYKTNRAPFGLYTHHSWFLLDQLGNSTSHTKGYLRFLDYLLGLSDVYIVSMEKVLDWMKNPYFVDEINGGFWDPIKCSTLPQTDCPEALNCNYDSNLPQGLQSVVMGICSRPCPTNYPYLGNVNGN